MGIISDCMGLMECGITLHVVNVHQKVKSPGRIYDIPFYNGAKIHWSLSICRISDVLICSNIVNINSLSRRIRERIVTLSIRQLISLLHVIRYKNMSLHWNGGQPSYKSPASILLIVIYFNDCKFRN